jgi:hypothetical protein
MHESTQSLPLDRLMVFRGYNRSLDYSHANPNLSFGASARFCRVAEIAFRCLNGGVAEE